MNTGLPAASQEGDSSPTDIPFSQDEDQFKSTMCYDANASVASILTDVAFFRQFDAEQSKKKRFWGFMLAVGIVGIVVGAVGILTEHSTLGFVVGSPGLVLSIVAVVCQRSYGNLDLDDRRYEIVSGVLGLLRADMDADASVSVSLDFRPHNHAKKMARKGKVGYWNAKFFTDPWLGMRGRLIDGTKFTLSLIEKQQDRHRTKISASGKTKHKHKTKNSSEAIVTLKFKQKRYPKAQELKKKITERVKLPRWVELKSVNMTGDVLTLRTTTKQKWDVGSPNASTTPTRDGVNWVAMMFLSLYFLLNESKQ